MIPTNLIIGTNVLLIKSKLKPESRTITVWGNMSPRNRGRISQSPPFLSQNSACLFLPEIERENRTAPDWRCLLDTTMFDYEVDLKLNFSWTVSSPIKMALFYTTMIYLRKLIGNMVQKIFFRKKYFSPQEIYFFSARNIFFRKKYIFSARNNLFPQEIFFSARNISSESVVPHAQSLSQSLARASCWGAVNDSSTLDGVGSTHHPGIDARRWASVIGI